MAYTWKASQSQFNPAYALLVIALDHRMAECRRFGRAARAGVNLGGTMRLGGQHRKLAKGTISRQLYGKDMISERHRHRYEFNNGFRQEPKTLV